MASKQILEIINRVKQEVDKNGWDIRYADAYYQYGLYLKDKEKDIDMAMKCFTVAKRGYETIGYNQTGGDMWQIEKYCMDNGLKIDIVENWYKCLLEESYYKFESFIFYLEKNRPQSKRFYLPRRKTLRVVCQDLQDLEDDKYKFYGLSMPSRTGKSTICILFLCWIGLRKPNSHNAMGGHSGILAKGFHKELLNIIDTDEYTFKEMFAHFHPNHVCLRDKSAEEFTITLDESDRFATFTCRGIDGTWTGAVDISGKSNGVVDNSGYLYVDDLVRDREHSLSPTRMENTFQEYLNKMVDRKNDGAKELMVGTLWNVLDPLERLRIQYENEEGYFFRRLSALDENDESNFDYDISGFSTQYYREMRERLDDAEWMAKYQQKPYVREGILMPKDELNYFNGIIPEGDYRILAPCDVAYGGGDSLSMPIGYEFDNGDVYIVDWVFNKGAKETTIPLVTGKIIENQIRRVRFEGNQGGDMYADYIDKELHNRGWKCAIESKKAPNTMAKTEKIIAYSGDIKRKYYFLQEKRPTEEQLRQDKELGIKRFVRSKEYQTAMDEMCTFVTVGKNISDDAIDSITQMEMMIEETQRKTVKIIKGLM